ncbi:MAG: tRNA pseudouridine(38-40) synthase TruA [Magnetospiraceae bacterium]
MPRYKLTLEYDGTDFVGWQRQTNGLSVQQVVEEAITAYCGQACRLHVAGRTDAGVHALGQVAHFDGVKDDPPDTVRDAVNFHAKPHAVAILAAEIVPGEEAEAPFHARFSATSRSYVYRILNRRAPAVLDRGRVWWTPKPLDARAMDRAAKVLLGKHDFTTFRAAECQADSPIRTLDRLDVSRAGEEILIHAHARSFLHHQVRNMVGSLALVGLGKWGAKDLEQALAAKNRAAGGPTAPAAGLYLERVGYGV